MDTIGLLAAWLAILSFLGGIVLTTAVTFLARPFVAWWAGSSKSRAEKRVRKLVAEVELYRQPVDGWYTAGMVSLYGTMILTLTAAIGMLVVSIQVLDLGPALLAAVLPFYINGKLITKVAGLLTLGVSYFFILRLCYLGVKLWRQYSLNKADYMERNIAEIARLRTRFNFPLA